MGPAPALLAFGLSLAAVLTASGMGDRADLARSLQGLGLLPLALLPWVALAGLPPRAGSCDRGASSGSMAWLALGLPVLALAARLDRAEGLAGRELAWTAAGGLLLAVLLARAAQATARQRPPGDAPPPAALRLHGLLWSALVLVPVLLELVLVDVARGRGEAPPWPEALSAASPLGWLARRAADPSATGPPYAPLALCAILLALVRLAGGAAPRRPAP